MKTYRLNMKHFKNLIITFVAVVLLNATFSTIANAKDGVQIVSSAWVVKEEKINNEVKKNLEEAKKVYPGDVVVLRNAVVNNSTKSIADIEVVNPIPKNMTFDSVEVISGVDVLFSVDGKSFNKEKDLFVTDKTGAKRLASKEEYTHIKWKISSVIKSSETRNVEFTAFIK